MLRVEISKLENMLEKFMEVLLYIYNLLQIRLRQGSIFCTLRLSADIMFLIPADRIIPMRIVFELEELNLLTIKNFKPQHVQLEGLHKVAVLLSIQRKILHYYQILTWTQIRTTHPKRLSGRSRRKLCHLIFVPLEQSQPFPYLISHATPIHKP